MAIIAPDEGRRQVQASDDDVGWSVAEAWLDWCGFEPSCLARGSDSIGVNAGWLASAGRLVRL
jgi:hypothetical protein